MNDTPILNVENLSFAYSENKYILKDITFSLKQGEIAVFLGKSGVGKSTLIRLLSGLEHPSEGQIFKYNTPLNTKKTFIPPNKRNVAVVFQEDSLFPHLTVYDNITVAQKKINRDEILKLLKFFEMSDHETNFPHELSGGQKQRVALARSLAQNPDVILLDEPFSALDYHLRQQLRRKFKRILKEKNISALFITHDREEALQLADKLFIMNNQQIIQSGTPKELLSRPINSFVANFLGAGVVINQETIQHLNDEFRHFIHHQFNGDNNLFIPYQQISLSTDPSSGIKVKILEKRANTQMNFLYLVGNVIFPYELGPLLYNQDLEVGDELYLHIKMDPQNIRPVDTTH